MSSRHFLVSLVLAASVLFLPGSLRARDLTIVRNWLGRHYVFGADDAGFHRQEIPLQQIDSLELTQGLAHVVGGRTHLLYGLTPRGIVRRRIDLELGNQVHEIAYGDRIAVAKGMLVHIVYAVTDRNIEPFHLHSQVHQIAIEGNIAFLRTSEGMFLFGAAQDRVTVKELGFGPTPDQIMLARNQAVITKGRRTWLFYLNETGFHQARLDESGQPPSHVYVGGFAGHTIGEPDQF